MLHLPKAEAQDATRSETDAQQTPTTLDEVRVTGSRVARPGYQAPTPLTTIDRDEIDASAPVNIADFVNQLPSVVGSTTPATSNVSIGTGAAGINAINLRNLGTNRTLVLLDGVRSVGSQINGAVDVNTYPQGLIRGVEVSTGGASAAYGSDAVSGVVNFILDKYYTGIKGSVEAGQTTYGDDDSRRYALTAGAPFADGRGHVLFNAEKVDRDGIFGVPRAWNDNGWYIVTNPDYAAGNGQPERLVTAQAGLSNAAPGGIITNTALRGTYFGVGGTVNQFAYGNTRDPWTVGGDWEMVQVNNVTTLDPSEDRDSAFGRASFQVTDNVEVYGQVSWARHSAWQNSGVQLNQGNITILSDNAFIPAEVKSQLDALGITSFSLGSTNADLPVRQLNNTRIVKRYTVGASGFFNLWNSEWDWDTYWQHGVADTHEVAVNITNNARLALAQDAVFDTAGNIVCRSTLTDPGNGCIPFNRMGVGVNSQAALDYLLGDPQRRQRFEQDVVGVNFNAADAFENWAGPVSLAVGLEHRKEEVSGHVEDIYQSGWFVGNYLPSFGKYDVTEAYLETVMPLITGLDLNAAVRATDYSTSGYVTTWKAGLTWQPIDDILLRVTRSRDIRAPNLGELYQSGATRTNNLSDPFNNNVTVQFRETVSGNPLLVPESSDNWGIGAVFRPRVLPGFVISADYFDIKIVDAIGSLNAQVIADRCYEGNATYCNSIIRGQSEDGSTVITSVLLSPFNFAQQHVRGMDLEASYDRPLGIGDLSLRALASRYFENQLDNGIDVPTDSAGQNALGGTPKWLYRLSASYRVDNTTFTLTGRGLSSGVHDTSFIECSSGCPASTASNRTINDNHIAGAFYLDASIAYRFELGDVKNEVFFAVNNLANRDPAIVAYGPAGSAYTYASTHPGLYDYLGRTFRLGIRFDWGG